MMRGTSRRRIGTRLRQIGFAFAATLLMWTALGQLLATDASSSTVVISGTVTTVISLNVPPTVIAVSPDGSTMYVADAYTHQVLQVSTTTGGSTVFAGSGEQGYTGDGTSALGAEMGSPTSLAVDASNNVLILDGAYNVVRMVANTSCSSGCPYGLTSTTAGDIYTVAGNGTSTSSRPTGPATATALENPASNNWDRIGTDGFGDLIVSDNGYNEDISMVAGQSCPSAGLATCPYGLSSMTAGDIYWIAGNDFRGSSTQTNNGNGGPATSALLASPSTFVVDSSHDLIEGDLGTGEVRLVAGYDCSSSCPWGFASLTAGDIYTLASGTNPTDVSLDSSGNLIVADQFNLFVDVVAGSNCNSSCPYGLGSMVEGQSYGLENSLGLTYHAEMRSNTAARTTTISPSGMSFDSPGEMFVGNSANNTVDRVKMRGLGHTGYDMVGADGGVFVFPTSTKGGFHGSLPGLGVHVDDIKGMVPSPTNDGYYLVGADGGVFAFGNAHFANSLPGENVHVNDIVGIVPTADNGGYFLVGSDGGVFAFGDAPFVGSLPGEGVHRSDIIGIAAVSGDRGYWVVAADGTVYNFGTAPHFGSVSGSASPIAGITATPDGGGYWVVTQNGSVYTFGNALYFGSLPGSHVIPAHPVIGLVPMADKNGYWLIGSDGGIFNYGDAKFEGSLPSLGVNVTDVVGAVPTSI